MTQYTDSAALNGQNLSSNYFYTATSSSAGVSNGSGGLTYNGSVSVSGTSSISGTITSTGNGYFTITPNNGSPVQYQVLGSTADGNNLIFEASQASGSNTGPYYVLSSTGTNPGSATLNYSSGNNYTAPAPTCFAAGTMITTVRGLIAVENVVIGDVCITASNVRRPVVWVGHTRVHASHRARPSDVNPVVISRGALAENVPLRDLLVSPGHRILVNGKLFQAISLVNDVTIVQRAVDTIDYHHIELDVADALLAEGAPAESYIDVGNRYAFSNVVSHPSAPSKLDADPNTETFAPTVTGGEELVAVKMNLIERALRSGWMRTIDRNFHLEVAGTRFDAAARVDNKAWFILPEPATVLLIISEAAVCENIKPDVDDNRRLGVQVTNLTVDGRNIQLANPAFNTGFHDCETTEEDEHFRWTNGRASIQLKRPASVIEISIGRGADLIIREARGTAEKNAAYG